jgi:hypothetical protein
MGRERQARADGALENPSTFPEGRAREGMEVVSVGTAVAQKLGNVFPN